MEFQPFRLYPAIRINALYTVYVLPFGKDFRFPGESHPFWELDYVIRGALSFTSGDRAYRCTGGEAVLHRPDVFHTAWTEPDGGTDEVPASDALTISFAGSGMSTLPDGKFTLNAEEKAIMDLLLAEIPRLFSRYNMEGYTPLAMTAAARDEGYQILTNYLEILLLSLQRRRTEAGKPLCDEQARLYADIASYMRDHIDDGLRTDEIVRRFALSSSSLKALFRRFTGEGVMKYYSHLRVRRIIALLSEGHSVCEVAKRMHFSSQNYLSAFFKRETGQPPSVYLRSQQDLEATSANMAF